MFKSRPQSYLVLVVLDQFSVFQSFLLQNNKAYPVRSGGEFKLSKSCETEHSALGVKYWLSVIKLA